jgi:DNA-binding transcriptional ArsR family regulator
MQDIAEVAALLADRSRVAMLDVLLDGAAHPVGVLADAAGIAPSTASEHLARLASAGLVSGRTHGRQRLYVIADPDVATTISRGASESFSRMWRSSRARSPRISC